MVAKIPGVGVKPKVALYAGEARKEVPQTGDLSPVFEMAQELSLSEQEPVTVELGSGRYYMSRAVAISVYGLTIRGKKGTTVEFRATAPAVLPVPSPFGASVAYTDVTTDAIGLYVTTVYGQLADTVRIEGVDFLGLVSVPATANQVLVGIRVAAQEMQLIDVKVSNETTLVPDTTNLFGYNTLENRSVAQYWAFATGESKRICPSPVRAVKMNRLVMNRVRAMGEPLAETGDGQANARAGLLWARCVGGGEVKGVDFSESYDMRIAARSRLKFTGNPADADTLAIAYYDPILRQQNARVITFKNSPSATYDVQRGADKEATAAALHAKIQTTSIAYGGSDYWRAFQASDVGQTAGAAIVDIESAVDTYSGIAGTKRITAAARMSGHVVITAGTYGTVYGTQNKRRAGYWNYLMLFEESPFLQVSDIRVGSTYVAKRGIVWLSTTKHNDFSVDEWSEGHHFSLDNVIGDGVVFGGGFDAGSFISVLGSAFFAAGPRVAPGQVGATNSPMWEINNGNHKCFRVQLAAGNLANNDTITVADGTSTRIFTAKSSGATGALQFLTNADPAVTLDNFRLLLMNAQYLGLINAFSMDGYTAAGGGAYYCDVTFYNYDYEYSPSISSSSGNVTVTDISNPYRPAFASLYLKHHGMLDALIGGGCSLDARNVYGKLDVKFDLHHEPPVSLTKHSNEYFTLGMVGTADLNAADKYSVRYSAASSYIDFMATTGTDVPGLTYYVGTPTGASLALKAIDWNIKLADKMNTVFARQPCWYINLGESGAAPVADGETITLNSARGNYTFVMDHTAPATPTPLAKTFDHGTTYAEHAVAILDAINAIFPGHASLLGTTTVMVKKGGDVTDVTKSTAGANWMVRSDAADSVVTSAYANYNSGACTIVKGLDEADASFLTKTEVTADSMLRTRNVIGGGSPPTTADSVKVDSIRLSNVRCAVLSGSGSPLTASGYSGTNFVEAYGTPTPVPDGSTGNQPTISVAFNGGAKYLLYAHRDVGKVSKIFLDAKLHGPWGAGRFNDARFYRLGGSMTAADIKVSAASDVMIG